MTDDLEARLGRQIATDLAINDTQLVVEAVRRHHGGAYSRGDEPTDDEYRALRDVVEGELLGWDEPRLFE